jgi:hypothetical protein
MNEEHEANDANGEDPGVDPVLVAVLEQLWRAQRETPGRAWSLAKLSKQAAVPMSGLRRQLTALVDSGLAVMTLAEDGSGSASLTEDGRTFCAEVFGDEPGPDAP